MTHGPACDKVGPIIAGSTSVSAAPPDRTRPAPAPALAALRLLLGDRLSTARAVREQHGKDPTYHEGHPPDAVAFARTTGDVSEIVRICAHHGTPVIAFGTGTSLEGHISALEGGVSIDLSGMAGSSRSTPPTSTAASRPG